MEKQLTLKDKLFKIKKNIIGEQDIEYYDTLIEMWEERKELENDPVFATLDEPTKDLYIRYMIAQLRLRRKRLIKKLKIA